MDVQQMNFITYNYLRHILESNSKRNKKIIYILKHKRAFLETERQILGRNRFLSKFHDSDKIILLHLGFSPKMTSKIHRLYSLHHPKFKWIPDILGAIIDWECASSTKEDKQCTGYEAYTRYFYDIINIAKYAEKYLKPVENESSK